MKLPARWFWQVLCWGIWVAASLFWFSLYGPVTLGSAAALSTVALGLWGSTEALRWLVLRQGWLDLGAWALIWRLALLGPLAALLIQLVAGGLIQLALALHAMALPTNSQPYSWGIALGYAINTCILLWFWLAVWLFWQALQRYREGEIARWRAQAQQHQLALDLLKAQINPHFVFNALNNLRAMINEDTETARTMVSQLSHVLRHALYHTQRDTVTVAEELEVVGAYLALEQLHYDDSLRVTWDVDPSARSARIPPMLLQMLVENAVKHGIAKTLGGGTVQVTIRMQTQDGPPQLSLEVCNPGHWQPEPAIGATGLGLHNLRERLALFGGPKAGLEIRADAGQICVKVTLTP